MEPPPDRTPTRERQAHGHRRRANGGSNPRSVAAMATVVSSELAESDTAAPAKPWLRPEDPSFGVRGGDDDADGGGGEVRRGSFSSQSGSERGSSYDAGGGSGAGSGAGGRDRRPSLQESVGRRHVDVGISVEGMPGRPKGAVRVRKTHTLGDAVSKWLRQVSTTLMLLLVLAPDAAPDAAPVTAPVARADDAPSFRTSFRIWPRRSRRPPSGGRRRICLRRWSSRCESACW